MLEKAVLSTAECNELCGKQIIFEELLALYGSTILKPLRALPNGSHNWSKVVVLATINLAQSEGSLLNREKVETALKKRAAQKPVKLQEANC